MNYFTISKLDRRHNGYGVFTHFINYSVYTRGQYRSQSDNYSLFLDHRVWFWETFGPGCELGLVDTVLHRTDQHPIDLSWGWQTEHNRMLIYVTDTALAHFMLTHSS